MNACSLLHFSRGWQQLEPDIDPSRLAEFSRGRQHHSALQRGVFDSRQIHPHLTEVGFPQKPPLAVPPPPPPARLRLFPCPSCPSSGPPPPRFPPPTTEKYQIARAPAVGGFPPPQSQRATLRSPPHRQ